MYQFLLAYSLLSSDGEDARVRLPTRTGDCRISRKAYTRSAARTVQRTALDVSVTTDALSTIYST